jgi:protein-tyrosine phosphatase
VAADLPFSGEDGAVSPYRICFVCSGNICRSPTAEIVTRQLAAARGLAGQLQVDSAGIGNWHAGDDADPRAIAALRRRGYPVRRHCARQFQLADFAERDLVVALDASHLRALRQLARTPEESAKIRLLRSFDPAVQEPGAAGAAGRYGSADVVDLDVPDPYYARTAEFDHVLDLVEASCRGLLSELQPELTAR